MSDSEKLICGDCKGITTFQNKRGSAFIETMLWTLLFFPGIFYSIWRRKRPAKHCQYCGGDFLLPVEMASSLEITKPTKRNDKNL